MLVKPKNVDITIHKIYAEDGLELDSLLFEPRKKTKKIIIHIHGKEGHFIQNHFVTYMGYLYPNSGVSFLTFNNRGHDYIADMLRKSAQGMEWTTRGTAFDTIEESILDINGVVEHVKDLGYEEIMLQGHSIGPHKISYYIANNPKHKISKAIFLSPGDIIYVLNAYVPEWKKYALIAKKMIREKRADELMPIRLWSNAPASAKTFWNYTNPDSNYWIFNFTEPEREFKFFNKLQLPLLVIEPDNDFANGVDSNKLISILKKKTLSKKFTGLIIENTVHGLLGKEEEVCKKILSWVND